MSSGVEQSIFAGVVDALWWCHVWLTHSTLNSCKSLHQGLLLIVVFGPVLCCAAQEVYSALEALVDDMAMRAGHASLIYESTATNLGKLLSCMVGGCFRAAA